MGIWKTIERNAGRAIRLRRAFPAIPYLSYEKKGREGEYGGGERGRQEISLAKSNSNGVSASPGPLNSKERERERTGPAYICLTKILRASVQTVPPSRFLKFWIDIYVYMYIRTERDRLRPEWRVRRTKIHSGRERLLTQVLRKLRRIVGGRWYARSFQCGHWNAKLRRDVLDITNGRLPECQSFHIFSRRRSYGPILLSNCPI